MNEQLPIMLEHAAAAPTLAERAERIRSLVNTARGCIIEVGRELIEARKDIHGELEWEVWLGTEFSWSERTAYKFITVATAFNAASRVTTIDELTIDAAALYALAAPDVPPEARGTAVAAAEAGEHITKVEADEIIAAAMRKERLKFEALVAEAQEQEAARIERAVADATEQLQDDNEALEAEIKKLRDAVPDVEALVTQLCKATGKKKLSPAHYQHLACILGTAVTDGKKIYPPVTLEVSRAAETNLRVSGPAVRALEYFPAAPSPQEVRGALPASQAESARRNAEHAQSWLAEFVALFEEE